METKRWEEVRRTSPEKIAENKRWAPFSVNGATLAELRALAGRTQEEVGEAMGVSGVEVGRFEKRRDVQVSTIRRYLEALGGEFHSYALFGEKMVPLKIGVEPERPTHPTRARRRAAKPGR
jgi:transcriptional regulator with XRE-family HTH domain